MVVLLQQRYNGAQKGGGKMDYQALLALIEEELDYLQNGGADITGNDEQVKAAGALLVLREYVVKQISEEQ